MPQIDDVKIRSASRNWLEALNAAYAAGEPIYEVDKRRMKFGQGVGVLYNDLPFVERGDPAVISLGDVVEIVDEGVTQIDITIPDSDDYESLQVVLFGHSDTNGSGVVQLLGRFNGDTAANYDEQFILGVAGTPSAGSQRAATSMRLGRMASLYTAGLQSFSPIIIEIPLHRMTGGNRTAISSAGATYGLGASEIEAHRVFGMWRSTANITQVRLFLASDSFSAGTQIICFGIRP